MTARATFRQDDVARLVKGVIAGGAKIARIEASPGDGKITIVTSDGALYPQPPANEWDRDLDDQATG